MQPYAPGSRAERTCPSRRQPSPKQRAASHPKIAIIGHSGPYRPLNLPGRSSPNPIDQFILAKLQEKGIQPAPPAPKLTLLRRVTYDLTGLPPTKEEITQFLNDKSPEAYAKVVDRLLASPRYGERWGRHWLDVARYADSTGMDEDNLYPHAWRYRDYVVEAFNNDTPFNDFVKQQLAGDLLPAKDAAERARNVVATGFLAIGPRPLAQQDRMQMIYDVVDEQIDTTTKAFLGLTVACARCHDHKFDPIPTKDYYGLASIFASTTTFRNQGRPGSISYMHYTPLDQRRIRSIPGAPLANTSQAVGDGACPVGGSAARNRRPALEARRISSSPRGTCSSNTLPSTRRQQHTTSSMPI